MSVGKADFEIHSGDNGWPIGAVEEAESERIYRVALEIVLFHHFRVDKAVGCATIDQGFEEFQEVRSGDIDEKGVGVVKSGRVETAFPLCTSGVNAALVSCGRAAVYFFESSDLLLDFSAAAERALAFEAEEEDFGQSFAVCPAPPQNRHRLRVNRRVRSSAVSLPSLPSLFVRSGFFDEEAELLFLLAEYVLPEFPELFV